MVETMLSIKLVKKVGWLYTTVEAEAKGSCPEREKGRRRTCRTASGTPYQSSNLSCLHWIDKEMRKHIQ